MKKQITPFLIVSLLVTVASFVLAPKALAATAKCYQGTYTTLALLATCPSPSTNPASGIVYYPDSGPVDTNPATCYASDPPQQLPGGTRRQFNVGECDSFEDLADNYSRDRCIATDGEWMIGSGPRPPSCKCPDQETFVNNTCQPQAPAPTTGGSEDTIDTATGPETDCDEESGNLNEDNCKIIMILNRAFSLVSGGIALAVIGNIIYAGIQYSMAQGDPSNTTKAKNRIRGAIIAFLMYISLYAFLQWLIPGGVF